MRVVSKPLGGLFRVPDFGFSNVLSLKQERNKQVRTHGNNLQDSLKNTHTHVKALDGYKKQVEKYSKNH